MNIKKEQKKSNDQTNDERLHYFFNYINSMFGTNNNPFAGFIKSVMERELMLTLNENTRVSFELFELDYKTCSIEDVKKRYFELAKQNHPDTGGNPVKFQIIAQAKDYCLKYLEEKNESD